MDPSDIGGLRAQVRKFAPYERHALHRDSFSRVSIVLKGEVAEDSAWAAARLRSGDVLFKSREIAHEDCFGPQGATIFSILFDGEGGCPFRAARLEGSWFLKRDPVVKDAGLVAFEAAAGGDDIGLSVAVGDLLAGAFTTSRRGRIPKWLRELHDALQDSSLPQVDIAASARAAGRHIVTVSRAFRQHFGMSITEHAGRQGVRRALVELARGERNLAEVAVGAGFYDQSHMHRAFRRLTGRTPGEQRALLAAAR